MSNIEYASKPLAGDLPCKVVVCPQGIPAPRLRKPVDYAQFGKNAPVHACIAEKSLGLARLFGPALGTDDDGPRKGYSCGIFVEHRIGAAGIEILE